MRTEYGIFTLHLYKNKGTVKVSRYSYVTSIGCKLD